MTLNDTGWEKGKRRVSPAAHKTASSQTNQRTTKRTTPPSKSLPLPMKPATASSPPTAAGSIQITPFDGAEESESSYPAFSRPTLTRKPSIRVRRHQPDEHCEEEKTRPVSAALREGSYVPVPPVSPIPTAPEGRAQPCRCRRQHIAHPSSYSDETSRNYCLLSPSAATTTTKTTTTTTREVSVRKDRPTYRKRSKLATLCRPRLLGWRVPLPLLRQQRGHSHSTSPGVIKPSRWEGRCDNVHGS
jgi:hypothetical protein